MGEKVSAKAFLENSKHLERWTCIRQLYCWLCNCHKLNQWPVGWETLPP